MEPDFHQPYGADLAYIHDRGFGDFAGESAPGLIALFREAGIDAGRIVDLGCGGGIWLAELARVGFDAEGVDLSPAMIEIARRRVPEAKLHVASYLHFPFPSCRGVTALGEVFNYLFDAANSRQTLHVVFQNVFDTLAPGGLLIFDVAEPGRCRGRTQAFVEGPDWTCLVEYRHNEAERQLTRRIVTFRSIGDAFRRHEETHRQQLYDENGISTTLQEIGFQVRSVRSYGDRALAENVVGFVAKRPLR